MAGYIIYTIHIYYICIIYIFYTYIIYIGFNFIQSMHKLTKLKISVKQTWRYINNVLKDIYWYKLINELCVTILNKFNKK